MQQKFYSILKKHWGYDSFRDGQLKIIESIYNSNDTLAVLPTGAGKSLCYQVPALAQEGVCLVISPLIALMQDQMSGLEKRNISCVCIHSGLSYRQQDILFDNVAYGNVKFLFISPERLSTRLFMDRMHKLNLSMVVIDEAHCISEWGHDFRPAYRNISVVRENLADIPFLALTATATKDVQKDISKSLNLRNAHVFVHNPTRKNLSYQCHFTENKKSELFNLLNGKTESILVYVNRRYLTNELQQFLHQQGIKSSIYHAGLDASHRAQVIEDWNLDKIKIIIATNAFGMGMDKPDVRLVVHYNLSSSLESYVQEAGRAGRDGQASSAIVLWNQNDIEQLRADIERNYPPLSNLQHLYKQICLYFKVAVGQVNEDKLEFDLQDFCLTSGMKSSFVLHGLKLFSDAGFIELSDKFVNPSRLSMDEFAVKNFIRGDKSSSLSKKFINTILRTYDGIFWDFRDIDEQQLANKMGLKLGETQQALHRLQDLGLGKYFPSFEGYAIQFKQIRMRSQEFSLPDQVYKSRKTRANSKLDLMVDYLNCKDCRQYFISHYFSFTDNFKCSKCDNCQKHLTKLEIEKIIMEKNGGEIAIHDLIQGYNEANKTLILDHVQYLLEEGIVSYSEGKISKHS